MIQYTLPPTNNIQSLSRYRLKGLLIAIAVMGIWASSLIILFLVDISQLSRWQLLPFVAWQTFLYTGLFITAHDAMHGVVFPDNPKINHLIGKTCLFFYGLLPYNDLLKNHHRHHQYPATEKDPDFHDGKHTSFLRWYGHFMKGYWNWAPIIILMIVYNLIYRILGISEKNLTYFWVFPSVLSSLQLFYFGTFLPHSMPLSGYKNPHRAQTISRPTWLSFITCYHFGYHEEHHNYPNVPWWQLPSVHKQHNQK